ncbi:MAG: CPBP family intramembrane glutamic endopeptidase [Nitriliruptoraceae bacterium]
MSTASPRSRMAGHRWSTPFWNPREARLRAAWRIVAMLAVYLLVTILSMAVLESWLGERAEFGVPVAIVLTALVTVGASARFLDRRPLREVGLAWERGHLEELLVGMAAGLAVTGAVLGAYLALGWAQITGWLAADGSFLAAFALVAANYAAVAFLEELLFRGYIITNASEGFACCGTTRAGGLLPLAWRSRLPGVLAVVTASLVFARFHGDSLTALQYLHFWLAGVLLSIPYLWTGNLAMSIGLHWAHNVGATSLFNLQGGLPALVRLEVHGPSPWAGGAGVIETLAIAAALPLMVLYLRHRTTSAVR